MSSPPLFEGALSSASALDTDGPDCVSPREEVFPPRSEQFPSREEMIAAIMAPIQGPRSLRFLSAKLLDMKEVHPWQAPAPLVTDPLQFEFQNRTTLYVPQWSPDPAEYLQNVDDGIGAVKYGLENGMPQVLCLDDRHLVLVSHILAEVKLKLGDAIGQICCYHGGDFTQFGYGI